MTKMSNSDAPIRHQCRDGDFTRVERPKRELQASGKEGHEMRVMVIIKANEQTEAGVMPSEELLTAMTKFNEELMNAGIMLGGDGLHPSSKGKRVAFKGKDRIVTDGPFPETKELIAGFWIWKVDSMEEAIEWVKKIPDAPEDLVPGQESIVEIRPIFEEEDFGEEFTPEAREREDRIRLKLEATQ
jgi:hypothetical protein